MPYTFHRPMSVLGHTYRGNRIEQLSSTQISSYHFVISIHPTNYCLNSIYIYGMYTYDISAKQFQVFHIAITFDS